MLTPRSVLGGPSLPGHASKRRLGPMAEVTKIAEGVWRVAGDFRKAMNVFPGSRLTRGLSLERAAPL